VAYRPRCADDWHGYGRECFGERCFHRSGLRWRSSYDYRLYSHIHAGLHHRHWIVIAHYRERFDELHSLHVQG
jgi:hypothetical protein